VVDIDRGAERDGARPAGDPAAGGMDGLLQTIIDFLPSGVTLFDVELRMVACNRQFRELLEFPDALFADGLPSLHVLAAFNAARGEYGPGDPAAQVREVIERARRMQPHVFERCRPNGRVLEMRGTPLPGGGFVSIYTDMTERKRIEDEARRAANYLDAVVSALPQGLTMVDEKLEVALWNPAFVKVQNLPEGFMRPGIPFAEVVRFNAERGEYGAVDVAAKVRQAVELARRFEPHRLERTRGDGGVLEIEGRVVSEDGRAVGMVTTYTDITERVRNEQTIRRVRDLMSDAVNFSPTFIWETDADGHYTFVQGMEKILGVGDAALLGRHRWRTLCKAACQGECERAPERAAAGCEIMRAINARRPLERHTLCAGHRDGREVWLSCSAQPVYDGAPGGAARRFVGYRGVDVDISELTRAHRELEEMALHDPLTGLANRRKFRSRYDLEVARQERAGGTLALLLIDIDHFKRINDRWGHLVGDECLKGVANVLAGNLRKVDLVARFGGEEFVVLLADCGLEGALTAAENLRAAVAAAVPAQVGGQPLTLAVSVGVAATGAGGARRGGGEGVASAASLDFDRLLASADLGVYAAKDAGRNRVCVGAATPPADGRRPDAERDAASVPREDAADDA